MKSTRKASSNFECKDVDNFYFQRERVGFVDQGLVIIGVNNQSQTIQME